MPGWIFIIRKNKTVTFSFLTKHNHIPVLLHILHGSKLKKSSGRLLATN